MRIAIFLQNENFLDESMIQAYAFNIQNNVITSISEELLSLRNIKYLLSWLLAKNIDIIYMNNYVTEEVKSGCKRINIRIKSLKELKYNPLLSKFLMKEK